MHNKREGSKLKNAFLALSLLILLISFTSSTSHADSNACPKKSFFNLFSKRKWINDQVEVIYFPNEQHTKLRVRENVYANECPEDRCTIKSIASLDNLSKSKLATGPQFRFQIRVTEDELNRLEKYLASGEYAEGINCAHSACKALNRTTGVWVPLPISISPAASAAQLAFTRLIPGSRVVGMHFSRVPMDNQGKLLTGLEVAVGVIILVKGSMYIHEGIMAINQREKK